MGFDYNTSSTQNFKTYLQVDSIYPHPEENFDVDESADSFKSFKEATESFEVKLSS